MDPGWSVTVRKEVRGGLTWTPSTAQPPRACRLLGSEPSFQRHANRRLEVPGWAGKALSAVLIRIPATGSGESAQSCLSAPSNWGGPLGWLGGETPPPLGSKTPQSLSSHRRLAFISVRKSPPWASSSQRVSSKVSEREPLLTQGISV